MKLFVVLAVLSITACSDSNNSGTPDGSSPTTPNTTPTNPGATPTNPGTTQTSGQNDLPFLLQMQLETFFEVANGEALQEMSAILLHLVSPVDSGFTFQSSRTEESDLTNRDLYSCTSGGSVEVWSSSVANEPRTNANATECAFGPRVVSGLFYLTDPINVSDENYDLVSEVRDYTVTDNVNESTTTLNSGIVRYNSADASGNPRTATSWGGEFLDVSRLAGSYSVNSTNYITRVNDSGAPLENGSLGRTTNLNALIDRGNEVRQVRTTQAFQRSSGTGNFVTGVLMVSGNQSSVELDANSGAESTFVLTETKEGTTMSYEVPWSDRFQFKLLDPANTDLIFDGEAPPG